MTRTVAIVEAEITILKAELAVLKAASKSVALPEAGAVVSFKARNGALIEGAIVLGVKQAEGKGKPALIKLLVGSGVDAETITVFPSAIVNGIPHPVSAPVDADLIATPL